MANKMIDYFKNCQSHTGYIDGNLWIYLTRNCGEEYYLITAELIIDKHIIVSVDFTSMYKGLI